MLDSLRNRMESKMQQPLIDIERERDELKLKVYMLTVIDQAGAQVIEQAGT